MFENRTWCLLAELEWSPQGPHRARFDFFFWSAATEKYKKKPRSFRELKQAVEALTRSVSTNTCRCVTENFAARINACAMDSILKT